MLTVVAVTLLLLVGAVGLVYLIGFSTTPLLGLRLGSASLAGNALTILLVGFLPKKEQATPAAGLGYESFGAVVDWVRVTNSESTCLTKVARSA
jgi:hypothetical protein